MQAQSLQGKPAVLDAITDISVGNIFVKKGMRVPNSLDFASQEYLSWKKLLGVNSVRLELTARKAGWSFSLVAPTLATDGLGFQRHSALEHALGKMMSSVLRIGFNSIEVKRIGVHHLLLAYYVHLVAAPRQLRPNPFLRDIDPYYFPQSIEH